MTMLLEIVVYRIVDTVIDCLVVDNSFNVSVLLDYFSSTIIYLKFTSSGVIGQWITRSSL
jgi:hypothetical protein